MKVYNKQDFLKIPKGTFFAKGQKWFIDGFCIKGESITGRNGEYIDFFYHNLIDFEWDNSDDHADTFEKMLHNGISIPINKSSMRDGCFCDEDVFLVFENDDLKYIRKLINEKLGDL